MRPRTKSSSITLLDQVASSLTNLLPGLYAAKHLSPTAFGVFALVQVAYMLALGFQRAAFSEVAVLSESGHLARLGATDCIAFLSVTAAAAATTVLIATTDVAFPALAAATFGVAAMLVQDALRLAAIGARRPELALVNDALWLVTVVGLLVLAHASILPTSAWALAAIWGLSSVPGLIAGAAFAGWHWPNASRGLTFIRAHVSTSASFVGDWTLKTGSAQVAIYALGLVGGITTVAGMRAAQLLLGPLNILFSGVSLILLPKAAQLRDISVRELVRVMRWGSLFLGTAAAALGLLLAVLPRHFLNTIVGDQAAGVEMYAPPLALYLAASGLITGSNIGMRALDAGRLLVLTRTATSMMMLTSGVVGFAVLQTPLGGLWALALGGLAGVPIWEGALKRTAHAYAIASGPGKVVNRPTT